MTTEYLKLEHIKLSYENSAQQAFVMQNINLTLTQGEITCLLGPSGSGKSTILRAIAGFEPVRQGYIILDKQIISSTTYHLSPEKRKVGMMFQDYALFPHMTVYKNIAFGLSHLSKAMRIQRINEMLALVGLEKFASAYPHELSGGQQQRVALARSLAAKPKILLLDEPFSNLDSDAREHLVREVKDILKANQTTAIMVTHNQAEAVTIADKIAVLKNGALSPYFVSK